MLHALENEASPSYRPEPAGPDPVPVAITPPVACQITLVITLDPHSFTTYHHLPIVPVRQTVLVGIDKVRLGEMGCPNIAAYDCGGGCRPVSCDVRYHSLSCG